MVSKVSPKSDESPEARVANEQRSRDHNNWLQQNLEALFQRHNEEFQIHFSCECSDNDCQRQIDLSLKEYKVLRSMARCFVVATGHHQADIEVAIGSNKSFEIVQKATTYRTY